MESARSDSMDSNPGASIWTDPARGFAVSSVLHVRWESGSFGTTPHGSEPLRGTWNFTIAVLVRVIRVLPDDGHTKLLITSV